MVTGGHYIITRLTDWSIPLSHDDLVASKLSGMFSAIAEDATETFYIAGIVFSLALGA